MIAFSVQMRRLKHCMTKTLLEGNHQMENMKFVARRKAAHIAVAAALPLLIAGGNVYAGCTGSVASPNSSTATIFCTGSGSDVTNSGSVNSNAITIAPTATGANSTNSLYEFQGLGKTITNSGTINNGVTLIQNNAGTTQPTLSKLGIFIGSSTINDTAFTTAPTAGATTVTITTGGAATYVGQTITFGRLDAGAGDFFPGEQKTITAYDPVTGIATLNSALSASFSGTGHDALPVAYNVVSGSGTNTINNKAGGTISASIGLTEIQNNAYRSVRSGGGTTYTYEGGTTATDATKTGSAQTIYASASNTSTVRAIDTSIAGDYVINNAAGASITATHAGVGGIQAIDAGGSVTNLTVNNSGTVSITRSSTITLVANTATSQTATAVNTLGGGTFTGTALTAASLGSAAAIYSQEELDSIEINNAEGGIIQATGNFTPAIYLRAGEQTINNDGIIRTNTTNGFAIGSVSDGGEIRTLELNNNGTITGDILAVNGNAARWYTISTLGTLDNRLNINSNWGQLDSTIDNAGTITGNLYFSNGAHELTNEDGATLTGNIDVDQRDTVASGQTPSPDIGEFTIGTTVVGAKTFTFENAGTYTGNITIRTATSTALGAGKTRTSSITLIPTVNGSGAGSTLTSPSTNIAGLGGTLKIFDGTAATDGSNSTASLATIAPKSTVSVHKGEYFKVADTLYGSVTPGISNDNTPLVTWNIAKNAGGNLVIGVDSVASASTLGLSANSSGLVDALLAGTTALGGAIQNLTTAADLTKAAEQLRPEANNASSQAALAAVDHVSGVIGGHLDNVRVASNGASGISTGESAQGKGFWIQGFGFKGDQDKRNGVDGYSASTGGFALGVDTLVGNGDFRVGGAFSYASTGVDGDGVNSGNRTDIDSYQGTLYGSWNAGAWYVDAALGYGRHTFDTKRNVTFPVADVLKGSHDADQYLAKIGGGYPIQLGKATLTPLASLTYVRLDQDGFSETSSSGSGAALNVGDTQTDSFRTGLGAKVYLPLTDGKIKTAVEARAIWNHEFGDDSQDITSRFAAGGSSFTTNGVSQARDSGNLGLGLKVASTNGQTLSVNYDAEVKSDYVGHTATLQFRYDF